MTPQPATATSLQPVKTSAVTKPAETQQTFDQIQQVYDSIARRAFEIFESNGRWNGHDLSDWLQAESELFRPVHLELAESEQALTVTAEVPGFTAKDLDVEVEANRLTIHGKHQSSTEETKGKTIYSEQHANEVFRSINLPAEVESSAVSATLKDGILTIELPKISAKNVRTEPKTAS